jgi:putative membrane protein
MTKQVTTALLLAVSLGFIGNNTNAATTTSSKAAPKTKHSAPAKTENKTGVSTADQRFVEKAHQINLQEVKLGELAQQKGEHNDVKQYGRHTANDHGTADSQLKQWAEGKGLTLAADVDAQGKRTYDRLSKLSGAKFDKAYIDAMVSGHKQALALFNAEEQKTKDADLKNWVTNTGKTISEHLKEAEQIRKNVQNTGKGATKAKEPKQPKEHEAKGEKKAK